MDDDDAAIIMFDGTIVDIIVSKLDICRDDTANGMFSTRCW